MRKIVILIVILFGMSLSYGQSIIYNNPNNNFLIKGIENPLDYLVSKYNCEKISFQITNGELYQLENCKILIKPNNLRPVNVKAFYKNKLIGSTTYKVELLKPDIDLYCPYQNEKPLYTKAKGISFKFGKLDIDIEVNIKKYEMIILRGNEVLLRNTFFKSNFDKEQINIISKLKKDDLIIINNIKSELFGDVEGRIFKVLE